MSLVIPSVKEKFNQYLAFFENRLNQNSPLADKAFLRVLSAVLAMHHIELFKFSAERALQNLALTATGEDLDVLGKEYGIIRTAATNAVITAKVIADTGTIIPATQTLIGDANGMRYFMQGSITAVAGIAEIILIAEDPGTSGNLVDDDLLTMTSPISGSSSTATVAVITGETSSTLTTGAEVETDEDYRIRVLDEIRRIGGGGNAADNRKWSQEVAGVKRAYPYSGKPFGSGGTHYPGDRTVYVEADTDIDPNGVPPSGLLDQVRASITIDPVTGESRQPLGLTDETLYVEPITPITLYLQIHEFHTDGNDTTDMEAAILSAMEAFVKTIRPWISGLDPDGERNDSVTQVMLSDVIQDALVPFNSTVEHVLFGLTDGSYLEEFYLLNPGEIMILGGIDYV